MKIRILVLIFLVISGSAIADQAEVISAIKLLTAENTKKPNVIKIRNLLTEYLKYSSQSLRPEIIKFTEESEKNEIQIHNTENINIAILMAEETIKNCLYLMRDEPSHLVNNDKAYAALMNALTYLILSETQLKNYYSSNMEAVKTLDYRGSITSQISKSQSIQEKLLGESMRYSKYILDKEYVNWWKSNQTKLGS